MGACANKLQSDTRGDDQGNHYCSSPSGSDIAKGSGRVHRLSIVEQRPEFVRIDKLLNEYYRQFGVSNYFDVKKNGRFLRYILDNKLMNIRLCENLSLSSYAPQQDTCTEELSFVYFDAQFPLSNDTQIYITNHGLNKEQVVFFVVEYCWKYDAYPSPNRFLEYMLHDSPRTSLRNIHLIRSRSKRWNKALSK